MKSVSLRLNLLFVFVSALVLWACDSSKVDLPVEASAGSDGSTAEQGLEDSSDNSDTRDQSDPHRGQRKQKEESTHTEKPEVEPSWIELIEAELKEINSPSEKLEFLLSKFKSDFLTQNPRTPEIGQSGDDLNKEKAAMRVELFGRAVELLLDHYDNKEAMNEINKFYKVLLEERGDFSPQESFFAHRREYDGHRGILKGVHRAQLLFYHRIAHGNQVLAEWYSFINLPLGWNGGSGFEEALKLELYDKYVNGFTYVPDMMLRGDSPGFISNIRLEGFADYSNYFRRDPADRAYYFVPQLSVSDYQVEKAGKDDRGRQLYNIEVTIAVNQTADFIKNFMIENVDLFRIEAERKEAEAAFAAKWQDISINRIWLTHPGEPWVVIDESSLDSAVDSFLGGDPETLPSAGVRTIELDGSEYFRFEFQSPYLFGEDPRCQGACFATVLVELDFKTVNDRFENEYVDLKVPISIWFDPEEMKTY